MQHTRQPNTRIRFQNTETDFDNEAYRIQVYFDDEPEGLELGSSSFVGAPYSNSDDYTYSNLDFDFQSNSEGNIVYSRFHAFYSSYSNDRTFTFDSALGHTVMAPLDYDDDGVSDLFVWAGERQDQLTFPIVIGSGPANIGTHMPNYFWYGRIVDGSGSFYSAHDGITSASDRIPVTGTYNFSGGVSGDFANANDSSNSINSIFADLTMTADFNSGTLEMTAANSVGVEGDDFSFLDFSVIAEIDGSEVDFDEATIVSNYFQDADDVDFYGRFYGPNGNEIGGSFAFLKLGPLAERQKGQWYAGAFGVTNRDLVSTPLNDETVLFVSTSSFDDNRVLDTLEKGQNRNYVRTGILPGPTRNESFSGSVSGNLSIDVQVLDPNPSTQFASFSYGSSSIHLFTLDVALGDVALTDNGRKGFFSDRGLSDAYEDFLSIYTNIGAADEYEAVVLSGLGNSGSEYSVYAFAQGNNTPNSSIPSLNGETFSGFSNGVYFDGTTNAPKITRSDIDITFNSASLAILSSTNTYFRDPSGDANGLSNWTSASNLNFSQSLAKSQFSSDAYLFETVDSSDASPNALGAFPTDVIHAEFFGTSGQTIAGTFYFAQDQQLYQAAFYTQK